MKMNEFYVNWGGDRIKLTWIPTNEIFDAQLITSAHAVCFYQDEILLVDIKGRGFDLPGGHREDGETALDCCLRETYEEGYVKGDATLLGYLEVNHCENTNWHEGSKYPKVAYQAMYRVDITEVLPFQAQFEASKRIFVPLEDVHKHHGSFNPHFNLILQAAANVIKI